MLLVLTFFGMLIAPIIKYNNVEQVYVNIIPKSLKQITKPKKAEVPLHDIKLPDFAHLTNVKEKKQQFFNFLAPAVKKENKRILAQRKQLLILKSKALINIKQAEKAYIIKLAKQYKLKKRLSLKKKIAELIVRIDEVPAELVLVQAANESAWGTSRFARIGLNFFGIWCYTPQCGMIPNGRSGDDKHEVAAFKSVDQAVQHYFYNINTHNAYKVLREIRRQLRIQKHPLKAKILASGLSAYSSRGEHYVLEITKMIEQNQSYITAALNRTND